MMGGCPYGGEDQRFWIKIEILFEKKNFEGVSCVHTGSLEECD
jgi:hypothetical protein